jgi:hypothetical protein
VYASSTEYDGEWKYDEKHGKGQSAVAHVHDLQSKLRRQKEGLVAASGPLKLMQLRAGISRLGQDVSK